MSPLRVIIRPEAEEEAQQAAGWYEGESPGLGVAFLEVIEQLLDDIAHYPRRFPVVHRDVRRALLKRFPYGIFFWLRNDHVRVLAIIHLARHPDRWKRRR